MKKILAGILSLCLTLNITACGNKETSKAGIAGVPSASGTGTTEPSSVNSTPETVGTVEPSSVVSQSETTGSSVVEWTPPETEYINPDACYNDMEAATITITPRKYKESELQTYEFEGTGSIKVPKSFKLISEERGTTYTVLMFETDVENIRVFLIASPDVTAEKYIFAPNDLLQFTFKPKTSTGFRLGIPRIPDGLIVTEKCPNLLKKTDYYINLTSGYIKNDTKYADDTYSVIIDNDEYFGAYADISPVETYSEGVPYPAFCLFVYNNSPTFTSDVCYTDLIPIAAALINEAVFS